MNIVINEQPKRLGPIVGVNAYVTPDGIRIDVLQERVYEHPGSEGFAEITAIEADTGYLIANCHPQYEMFRSIATAIGKFAEYEKSISGHPVAFHTTPTGN